MARRGSYGGRAGASEHDAWEGVVMAQLAKTVALLAALLGLCGPARADLTEAVEAGDLAYLRALLDAGLPPDPASLDRAARLGNLEAVRLLLEAGTHGGAGDQGQYQSPLEAAAAQGHTQVAWFLLDQAADVDLDLDEAAARALQWMRPEVLRLLVDRGAEQTPEIAAALGDLPRVREAITSDTPGLGWTMLRRAAAFGQAEVAQFLLDNGVDANSPDGPAGAPDEWPPIRAAVDAGQTEMVRLLWQHGARATLHQAARIGDAEILQELLDEGADVNALAYYRQATPLHEAAQGGRLEAMQFLLQHGASVSAEDRDGYTPVDDCTRWPTESEDRQVAMLEYLLAQGAKPGRHWDEALANAAWRGRLAVARSLVDHGASVNARIEHSYVGEHTGQ